MDQQNPSNRRELQIVFFWVELMQVLWQCEVTESWVYSICVFSLLSVEQHGHNPQVFYVKTMNQKKLDHLKEIAT